MENLAVTKHISTIIGYKNPSRYFARAKFVFDQIDLRGKRVLEIGCGKGTLLAWAALQGASHVLGLEPEEDGATQGSYHTLQKVVKSLPVGTVEISSERFDDHVFTESFDIVILYNVINHLNEQAVMDLHCNPASYEHYLCIADKLRQVTAHKGTFILADAARSNYWGDLGGRSPFARSIEWKKHQNPALWKKLFEQACFNFVDLRWSYLYPLGKLSSNFLIHYFTISHFVMRFRLQTSGS